MVLPLKRVAVFLAIATVLAFALVMGHGLSTTDHGDSAAASWSTCHSPLNTNIHELSNPPSAWPGTRAAHVTYTYSGSHNGHTDVWLVSNYYTKNGWYDLNWDYYKSTSINYSHTCT